MAAGFGSRLLPLTDYLPKQLLPVANRPVLHHLLNLLRGHGFTELGINVHHFADAFRAYFGDGSRSRSIGGRGDLSGRGRVSSRSLAGERILVTSATTPRIDLAASSGSTRGPGRWPRCVKPVREPRRRFVVTDRPTRSSAPENPRPRGENPVVRRVLLERRCSVDNAGEVTDFGQDVFPALLRDDAAMHAFTTMSYWNDVGGLDDLRRGSLDAVSGRVAVEIPGEQLDPGIWAEDGCTIDATATLEGPIAIGRNVAIEGDCVISGPARSARTRGSAVGAAIRSAVLLPGSVVPDDGLAIAGIFGDASSLANSVLRYTEGSTQTCSDPPSSRVGRAYGGRSTSSRCSCHSAASSARRARALCGDCRAALPRIPAPLCERCGAPTAWPVSRCAGARDGGSPFASSAGAVRYDDRVRAVVAAWKERGLRAWPR